MFNKLLLVLIIFKIEILIANKRAATDLECEIASIRSGAQMCPGGDSGNGGNSGNSGNVAADDNSVAPPLDIEKESLKRAARTKQDPQAEYKGSDGLVEGDMVLKVGKGGLKGYISQINSHFDAPPADERAGSNAAIRDPLKLWPGGVVPYTLSKQFSASDRAEIAAAFAELHRRTCVRFVARQPNHDSYIFITNDGDGCSSPIGRQPVKQQPQKVTLGRGCVYKGTIIHELLHSLGFFHEQSRNDRDDYIKVVFENIQNGLQSNFDKYSLNVIDHLGVPYDYQSVMHYRKDAFGMSGQETIIPWQNGRKINQDIGQRNGLSVNDVRRVRKLYACDDVNPNCKNEYPWCNYWSRQRGRCTNNPFMRKYCMKACGVC